MNADHNGAGLTVFEQLCETYGGVFVYPLASYEAGLLTEMMASGASRVAQGTRKGQPMKLTLTVIDNPSCNAWAYSDDTGDYIAVHRGLIETLPKIFRALLSHPTFYPDVGDLGNCQPLFSTAHPGNVARDSSDWHVPEIADESRQILCEQLTELALVYVFQHELAHIYNGHTDWLGEQNRLAAIIEVSASDIVDLAGIERQTLEFDADSAAVNRLLEYLIKPLIGHVGGVAVWRVNDITAFGGIEGSMIAACVACQVVHLLYVSMQGLTPEELISRGHPHPAARIFILNGAVENVIAYRTGSRYHARLGVLEANVEQLVGTWLNIFGDYAEMYSVLGSDHVRETFPALVGLYTKQWARMHSDLDRLKRGGTLAPACPVPPPAFPDHPDLQT